MQFCIKGGSAIFWPVIILAHLAVLPLHAELSNGLNAPILRQKQMQLDLMIKQTLTSVLGVAVVGPKVIRYRNNVQSSQRLMSLNFEPLIAAVRAANKNETLGWMNQSEQNWYNTINDVGYKLERALL